MMINTIINIVTPSHEAIADCAGDGYGGDGWTLILLCLRWSSTSSTTVLVLALAEVLVLA